MTHPRRIKVVLIFLLALCIVRLWLMPLPSSFWVDEMVSAFLVHYGAAHPSLTVAPQVTETVYYLLPQAAEKLFGFSEIVYRLPSVLAMAIALLFIARLASRLIHPRAGWFAAFACLGLKGFNYEAADARPYALGICVAAASLWFLVRWLDSGRWREGLAFVAFAAMLWRVHLIFWPFYLVYVLYLAFRFLEQKTSVRWLQAASILVLLGVALIPVALEAMALLRQARAHVIVDLPGIRDLRQSLKFLLVFLCGGGAWAASRVFRWGVREGEGVSRSAWALILGWWLIHPLALFAFSRATGDSTFVARYLALALPGAALTSTLVAAYFIPNQRWAIVSAILGAAVLLSMGQWRQMWPPHHNSDWRAAARQINEWSFTDETPVICPSPFIEARPPVWKPDYHLPGFLYSYLPVYPIRGKPYLLPFKSSPEAEAYAAQLTSGTLAGAPRFMIYGGDRNVWMWRRWFASRPELKGWGNRLLGPFGDVEVAIFENPNASSHHSPVSRSMASQ